MSDATTESTPPVPTQIWYGSENDPFRALHDLFEVTRGEDRYLYECTGWEGRSDSCVKAALSAAGFIGGSPREVFLRKLDPGDGVEITRHFGFEVEDSMFGAVEEALLVGLSGDLGGWTSALMSQVGFHRSIYAFSHIWAAAGKPPVRIAHPTQERARSKGASGPASLTEPHELDPRARLALSRFKELTLK
jgi:hypothetical protein